MDIVQMLDQLSASLRDTAPVLWKYYENLLAQGFNEEQATLLVIELQRSMFTTGR